jgi:cytochrome c-type biogenesis protein CcmH/NrfG
MFDLVSEDLEMCIETLRQIANENGMERVMLEAELKLTTDPKMVDKVYQLCELYIYYYDKIKKGEQP